MRTSLLHTLSAFRTSSMGKMLLLNALFISLTLAGCKKELNEDPHEDYSTFIKLKPADKAKKIPGISFDCVPQEPGELGFEYTPPQSYPSTAITYNVTIDVSCALQNYSVFDTQNFTTLTVQYLNADNQLQVERILDDRDHLLTNNPFRVHKQFTTTLRTGQAAYLAAFYNPWGSVQLSITMQIVSTDGITQLDPIKINYQRSTEAAHITRIGQEWLIQARAVYLP